MDELSNFVHRLIDIIPDGALKIEDARNVIRQINEFLYTNYEGIGQTRALEQKFDYLSDFHKYWEEHHKEILNCEIDNVKCEQVADALHNIYVLTSGRAFESVWDKCNLDSDEICKVRFLTANQDFNGSNDFSKLARIYRSDPSIFDIENIAEKPEEFVVKLGYSNRAQNDKRNNYALKIAEFLLGHETEPFGLIDKFHNDIYALRQAILNCYGAGYGNKKTDMFLRDMVVLDIWHNVKGFDKIDVASDVNTIKVALRTGILKTAIPLVSSFLDIFCHQYSYIDEMNALAWRKVWEVWEEKYPAESISSPCLMDYFVYNVVGKQFCKESLAVFKGDNCRHVFRWHSARNKTCQVCYMQHVRNMKAHVTQKLMPCADEEGYIAIHETAFAKSMAPLTIDACPFQSICRDSKYLQPPKSISILGQTGWTSAYAKKGQGGGGLMA
jgi:hypothetical protein